jgi:hypothetical protein
MSKIALVSPASGTATFSITTPSGTSTDRTLTLPDTTAPILAGSGVTLSASAPANTLVTTDAGNVGIGTSSPGQKLDVNGAIKGNNYYCPNDGAVFRTADDRNGLFVGGTALDFTTFKTSNAERARITANGNFLVGTTSIIGSSLVGIYRASLFFSGDCVALQDGSSTTGGAFISFKNEIGTNIGTISRNGASTVAYNTSSDYRLKDNIAPMTGALARVSALKPVTYTWKADGSADEGFIAHELAEVCPAAVTGAKDAVETYTDEDGVEQTRPKYQGIDTSFLVATLTAAIQELNAKFEEYKAAHP